MHILPHQVLKMCLIDTSPITEKSLHEYFHFLFFSSQMVYNFPDESSFLISTVKGQLLMLVSSYK